MLKGVKKGINKLVNTLPSLMIFVAIMAIGTFFAVNPALAFVGAIAVAFGVYIGKVRKG